MRNVNVAISVGGHGGDGDTGGEVSVNNYNTIVTRNSDSHGIYAQSIGGAWAANMAATQIAVWLVTTLPDVPVTSGLRAYCA